MNPKKVNNNNLLIGCSITRVVYIEVVYIEVLKLPIKVSKSCQKVAEKLPKFFCFSYLFWVLKIKSSLLIKTLFVEVQ